MPDLECWKSTCCSESSKKLASLRTLSLMLSRPFASCVCSLLFVLYPLLSASGQSAFPTCTESSLARILYAPESNLERCELEILRIAKVSVDVAMYSFTDRELAEELVKLAQSGVKVRFTEIRVNSARRINAVC